MDATAMLDGLIDQLDSVLERRRFAGDAIDKVLASTPRETAVRSLRDEATIVRFRQELSDGMIRVDTAGKLLQLLTQVVGVALAGRS